MRRSGEGSIYKRADGRLAVELSVGPRGARQRFGPLYAADDDDAIAKLELLRRQAGVLGPADPSVQTVGQWLRWWCDVELPGRVEEGTIEATTVAGYEAKVRLYLIPQLGHIKLRQLTPQHVRGFMRTLASTPASRGRRPLSARSREYVHAILRASLECAKQCQQVDINAAELVPAPTVVRTKPPVLSLDNADRMLDVIEDDRLEALWLAALSVGLRPGEALGLCWPAVDLDAGEMEVCTNLVRIDGQVRMHDTKGHRSRTVSLPEPAVEVLRRHRTQQRKERLASPNWVGAQVYDRTGARRVDVDLVFTDTRGRALRQDWLEDELVRLCKRAGLAPMTPHKFIRHGGATLMLAQGVDIYTLRDILGHSSVQVTEIYAHVLDEAKRDAANRMGEVLSRRRRTAD